MTKGHQLFKIYCMRFAPASGMLLALAILEKLEEAAAKDPLATPAHVPSYETVIRWFRGKTTPNHSNRRLIAIALGAKIKKDHALVGGSIPIESWQEPA